MLLVKNLMDGKVGLVMGVTNDSSLAWSIAHEAHEAGAKLCFSFPVDAIKIRIERLVLLHNMKSPIFHCDVSEPSSVENLFKNVKEAFGKIDFIIHSIAFSDKKELNGKYINTSRENFLKAMDISCYSLTEVSRYGNKLMVDGGSILTLSYLGANRVIPNYNVMGVVKAALEASVKYLAADLGPLGIRVNAISAGAIRTAASSGIGNFHYILNWNKNNSPLRRNPTQEEVGKSGLYFLSDMSKATTGEIHYVDCGYNIIGMKAVDSEDIVL